MSQDLAPSAGPAPPLRPTRLTRRISRRVLGHGAVGCGVLSTVLGGSLYLWHSPAVTAVSVGVAAVVVCGLEVLPAFLRGTHRDQAYRSTLSRVPVTVEGAEFVLAMARYEAIASGQLDSASAARVLESASNARPLLSSIDDDSEDEPS
jgi:hypothetical protein